MIINNLFTLSLKDYVMPFSKNCELCNVLYTCRIDKKNTSRFCSRRCTVINAANASNLKRKELWEKDSKEFVLEKMKQSFETFFHKNEKPNQCWLWQPKEGKQTLEYGSFTFRGIQYKSNRAAWIIYKGEIPKDKYVLHTCDIRFCVNPAHLFLGTHDDNMKDMASKKRGKSRSKLTKKQVLEIRRQLSQGVLANKIAKDLNVSYTCIFYIKHNKSWKNLD